MTIGLHQRMKVECLVDEYIESLRLADLEDVAPKGFFPEVREAFANLQRDQEELRKLLVETEGPEVLWALHKSREWQDFLYKCEEDQGKRPFSHTSLPWASRVSVPAREATLPLMKGETSRLPQGKVSPNPVDEDAIPSLGS